MESNNSSNTEKDNKKLIAYMILYMSNLANALEKSPNFQKFKEAKKKKEALLLESGQPGADC